MRGALLVMLALMLVAGSSTLRADTPEEERWYRTATEMIHPHVEEAVGFQFPQPTVQWGGERRPHGQRANGTFQAIPGTTYGHTTYYRSSRPVLARLKTVAHELVHAADWYKNGRSWDTEHGAQWSTLWEAVHRDMTRWLVPVAAAMPDWPGT